MSAGLSIAAAFAGRQSTFAGPAASGGGGLPSLADPGDGGAENIADAAHRAHERGPIGGAGQLLAQPRHQRIDRPIEISPLPPPERAEQGVARQRLTWLADEG
jgi:hypothetical protein